MNIIFDKIIIENFLSLGSMEISFSDQGFVLVTGQNEEAQIVQSNGAGKSSIFDAIFWTLTGETLRGTSNIVNEHKISDGCSCDLYLHDNESSYRILRTKDYKNKGNTCEFYINDELLSNQIKKSQELLNKTLPNLINPDILGSIILLGQGLPYKFSSLSPIKRKDLLETVSGTASKLNEVSIKLDKEEDVHASIKKNSDNQILQDQANISGLESSLSFLQNQENETKDKLEEKILELSSQIDKYQENINDINQEITSIDIERNNIGKQVKIIEEYCQRLNSLKINITSQLNSIKSGVCPECGRPYEITEDTEQRRNLLSQKLQNLNNELEEKFKELSNLRTNFDLESQQQTELLNQKSNLSHLIMANNSEIDHIKKTIGDLELRQDKITEIENQISQKKINITENTKISNEETEVLSCISFIKYQLSRDFKGYMLTELIDFLSERSKLYSSYLFTTQSQVNVSLSGNKIIISLGDRIYENLSGGERQRVDLTVQFALRDLLMISSGFSCNILVLDEAFDNLDTQGSSALIKLITSEFSEVDSVFIITHHSEITVPYDKEIIVIKGNDGVSYLR